MNATRATRLDAWLRGIRTRSRLAVVLGGSINGLSFVRSLGRRHVPTLLLDSARLIGMYTRYGRVELLSPVEDEPEEWLSVLAFVGSRIERPSVLFATSDPHVAFVAERARALRCHYRFVTMPPETVEQLVNKRLQYALADSLSIPIARSWFPGSLAHLQSLQSQLTFPCILKPCRSHSGRKRIGAKVLVMHSPEQLVSAYTRVADPQAEFMVQEIIPGDDTALFGYLGFWDADGQERQWLTKQKLRQFPVGFGDGAFQVTVDAPEVAELSRRLLRALDYRGFVSTEFKFDARDGSYRLIEVNPRTILGNQLAIGAGVDFPWIGYNCLASPRSTPLPCHFERGVTFINEELDFKAFLALRKTNRLNLAAWCRCVMGAKARATGALDDPLPFVVVILRLVRGALRQLAGALRSRRAA